MAWRYRVLRVLQLRHHLPREEERHGTGGGARLVFACGTLPQLNRFVRHGLRLGGAAGGGGGVSPLAFDGLTLTDELGIEVAQAHPLGLGGGLGIG